MNEYYHKYLKYKIKYFEIKYGSGKREEKNKSQEAASSLPPTVSASSAPSTPTQSRGLPASVSPQIQHQTPESISSVAPEPSTPKFKVNPGSIQALIEIKDDLLCRLIRCLDNPDLKITAKEQKTVKHQFYINIKKKSKDYAHFSFHYPEEFKEALDMFDVDTLHLKLDINKDIVFNLVNDDGYYRLKSNMDDCAVIHHIGEDEFRIVKKIIECFELIFNRDEYRKIFEEPAVRRLDFYTLEDLKWDKKCQKIKLQGLPVAERINYDFVKATTLTDLLAFFWTIFSFLGFSTLIFSSFFSLHKYFGRSNSLIAFLAILYIFVAPFTSLFHTPKQVWHLISPWTKILSLLYDFGFFLIWNLSHLPVSSLHIEPKSHYYSNSGDCIECNNEMKNKELLNELINKYNDGFNFSSIELKLTKNTVQIIRCNICNNNIKICLAKFDGVCSKCIINENKNKQIIKQELLEIGEKIKIDYLLNNLTISNKFLLLVLLYKKDKYEFRLQKLIGDVCILLSYWIKRYA